MKHFIQSLLIIAVISPRPTLAQTLVGERPSLVFENEEARLVVDLAGGSFREFRFRNHVVNPLNWGQPDPGNTRPKVMGHFLCLDRWGPPSASEGANGMSYHGEAGRVVWNLDEDVHTHDGVGHGAMSAQLPMAGISIQRSIEMAPSQAIALVHETVTNDNKLGRAFNMVQHPSVGPPFLTTNTVVDANGRRGFAQGGTLPEPEEPSFYWPQALNADGAIVNLRHLHGDHNPNVTSFVIDEEIGWVTAATPEHGLLIGYVWSTDEYPWLDIWRNARDGQPNARGLEFGTTGLHQPFPVLMEKGRIFGRKLFEYLDAQQTVSKRFGIFLMRIPNDFAGVGDLKISSEAIEITERSGGQDRTWSLAHEGLLQELRR